MIDFSEIDGYLGHVWIKWAGKANYEKIHLIRDPESNTIRFATEHGKERIPTKGDRESARVEVEYTGRESQERFLKTVEANGWRHVSYRY
ncbi:hypothetical protein [Tuwongella immobilis]|uniref:Uncharacterized protein n=1 Tax=Tuwongella immobilis TaxID=692036 RepID=A0A6C2YRL5_9BACT|nr:hypothetical protein [Tuwongella immobilis]VIP04001.1 unnamed protein product [Tuwongella immobilis]VTS05369.1 unnamed protein product [Tuwongella immobilis]